MKNYTYQNNLIGKKQLKQLLSWSFTNYDSMQACFLADELKYLGFKYATQAGISISIEDLKIPFVKNLMLEKANKEIIDSEKVYLKGKITEIERFQKIIDTWSLTSESLKDQVIHYFKNYDPLNSVYIMAFSGARGNLSQVRQLVGMRGLMSDPSGEIMKLPIKKNFREGLTVTDYLMSGYGARKGIIDTALKTANSGYLTRRLIDVAQDILIREKDCLTTHSFLILLDKNDLKKTSSIYDKILGRIVNKPILDLETGNLIAKTNTPLTPSLIQELDQRQVQKIYIRSPLTCNLYRSICQKCYGWDLANENLVDIGEAVGILAGQSIGEPGTQLTMRTFHTGGIFTSEARQQIVSPLNGIIRFSKRLKTVILRTNRGEDVLVTKNSGSLVLIPDGKNHDLVQIEVLRNTILFPKNNQYILKDTVIGELINTNKQVKTEVKPIVSDKSGEIFMPRLKKKVNLLNHNKLLWILSGQLYNSPNNSFINFYPDYKLTKYSYIFRTKIINHYPGFVKFINNKQSLYQQSIKLTNNKYSLLNSTLKQLPRSSQNYILNLENLKYLVKIKENDSKSCLHMTQNKQFGTLATNSFRTLTGGILYYDYRNILNLNEINQNIDCYWNQYYSKENYKSIVSHRTILWLEEEVHKVDCEQSILLVEHGDLISEGFELIPTTFSKTSGIVIIRQKNNRAQTISIKSGLVYEGQQFKNTDKKIYYPGEIIFSNIPIKNLSFCEHIIGKKTEQLLIRPVELYEVPYSNLDSINFQNQQNSSVLFKLDTKNIYVYKPNQILKSVQNLNLIKNKLIFKTDKLLKNQINIEIVNNRKINSVDFRISERLNLNNYISPSLKYKNLQPCSLIQKNQFVDSYTLLGYLEAITLNSIEIVKFKIKKKDVKQILLISNKHCLTLEKKKFPNKKLNDFIVTSSNVNETGKIIIENKNYLTLQKGNPYFFPNCKNDDLMNKSNLQYKLVSSNRIQHQLKTDRSISLNYSNRFKLSMKKNFPSKNSSNDKISRKFEFSKLFIKKDGKLYSSLIPQFFKKFSIQNKASELKINQIVRIGKYKKKKKEQEKKKKSKQTKPKKERMLLVKSSDLIGNEFKEEDNSSSQLTFINFVKHSFDKSQRSLQSGKLEKSIAKSVGLYSITEDFFEQEVNSVFCKNSEFIEDGETIGLLNLEKEITGDIVQGLPRIEEILEARKKNLSAKKAIPTSQKKSLLVQQTSLDPSFEFRKLGTVIQESEKINPHKLLKTYFNYYGLIKSFLCDRTESTQYNRLLTNYEGSYKSFKKVQSFILKSVQAVYESQGVTINDKHLEVIIKQMTTKILITSEGNTPLLRKEVLDLYHIKYINQIISAQKKQPACYVPLLLGITKAALNNPSFISAASFQETTRVLTKAAIEGRIDWLRGLKENIITGHLIPAGTGSQNYRNCFNNYLPENEQLTGITEPLKNLR